MVPSARYIPQPPSLGPLGSTHMAPSTPTHFGFAHTAPCTFPAQTTRPDRALILWGTPPFVPSLILGSLHSGHSFQANSVGPLDYTHSVQLNWRNSLGSEHSAWIIGCSSSGSAFGSAHCFGASPSRPSAILAPLHHGSCPARLPTIVLRHFGSTPSRLSTPSQHLSHWTAVPHLKATPQAQPTDPSHQEILPARPPRLGSLSAPLGSARSA